MNNNQACNGLRVALIKTFKVFVPIIFLLVLSMAIIFVGFNTTENVAFASSTDNYYSYDSMTSGFDYSNFAKYESLNLVEVSDGIIGADTTLTKNTIYYYNCSVSYANYKLTISFDNGSGMIWLYNGFTGVANNNKGFTFEILATATNDFYMSYRDASTGYTTGFTSSSSIIVEDNSLRAYYIALASNTARNVVGLRADTGTIVVDQLIYVLFGKTGTNATNLPKPFFIPFNENIITDPASYSNGYNAGYQDGIVGGIHYSNGYQPDAILDFENRFHFNKSLGNIEYSDTPSGAQGYSYNNGNADIYYSVSPMAASWDYSNTNQDFGCYFVFDLGKKVLRGSTLHFDMSYFAVQFYLDGSPVSPFYVDNNPALSGYYNYCLYPYSSFNDGIYHNRYDMFSNGITFYDAEMHTTLEKEFDYTMEDNSQYVVFMFFTSSRYVDNVNIYCSSRNNENYVENGITYSYTADYNMHKYTSCQIIANDYSLGYYNGKNDGYYDGKNAGYEEFRQDYLNGDNDFTFRGFFSSIVSAPVSVISGALDFDFLGFNVKGLILSLLSIVVIVFVIKMFI